MFFPSLYFFNDDISSASGELKNYQQLIPCSKLCINKEINEPDD